MAAAGKKFQIENPENTSSDQLRCLQTALKQMESFCSLEREFQPKFFIHRKCTDSPIVSVILPVYNAERYLVQALDSLVNQTLLEIEIVCVDDGSSDFSVNILDFYAMLDGRVKVLHQSNRGGGAARNLGMKHASGRYLAFMDADDFCSADMLCKMVKQMEYDQADLLVSRKCNYDIKTGMFHEMPFHPAVLQLPRPFPGKMCPDHLYAVLFNAPWGKLFSADFIRKHDLWFQEIKNSNDLYFSFMTSSLADRISILDESLYYYCVGIACSTQATKHRDPLLFLTALQKVENDLRAQGAFNIFESAFREALLQEFMFNFLSSKTEEAFCAVFQAARKYLDSRFFASFPASACLEPDIWQNLYDMMQFESPFQFLLDRYFRQVPLIRQAVSDLENSRSYRIGQAITWLPRQIRDGISRMMNHKT